MNLKRFSYLGLLIVMALIVVACSPQATPEPTATSAPIATDTPAPTATTEALIPSISGSGEVDMGFTEDGAPYRGNPNAPVTLLEYSEFQ